MAKWLDKYEQGGLVLKKKTKDNYGKKPNVNDVKVSAGPNFVGEGYTAYNWKSPAWGGQFAMGGALPGSVGFMYARTQNPAPANGKYTKKTLASAQGGKAISPDADDRSTLGFNTSDPAFQNVKSNAFVPFDRKDFEGLKQNIAGYMNSPLYMERLSKSIPNAENAKETQQRRLDNLLSIKLNPDTVNEGTHYNSNKNRINLGATDFVDNAILSHEIAHGIVPNITNSYGKQNVFAKAANVVGDVLQPFEQFSNSELEKINRPLSGKITAPNFDYMMARQEEHYKPQGSKASAKTAANETYGDLTGMRQLLLDNEITTEFGQDLTPEIFKKATENKRVMNSPAFKRMKLKFKDDDIIKMNNEVARLNGTAPVTQAQNGQEMKFYQAGLDFKPKSISKKGKKIVKDDRGQWAHPGEVTEISSPDITMQGVDYPVLGISDTGDTQMMYPDQDYKFDGEKVTEFPVMEKGGWLDKYKAQGGKSLAPYGSLQGDLPEVVVTSTKPSKWGKFKFAPYDPSKNPESISQWNPKPGEREAMAAAEQARRDEENSFYNNKHIKAFRNSAFMDPKALATATAAALVGPEVIPYIGAAMETPMVAGLTANHLLGAAAVTHGINKLPETSQSVKTAYNNPTSENIINAINDVGWNALDLAPAVPTLSKIGTEAKGVYNTVATGESALPIAWKSSAKGLGQEASDAMFKGIANTNKLSDADRALLLEYQYDSKPFTGRWGTIDQSKKDALNNAINNNELTINNNAILTRRFNPENQSLGAEFVGNKLNLGDRPSSFSAGVGLPSYQSGAVDRLVIPNRYAKQMGNEFLANEYGIPSDKTFDLLKGKSKDWAASIGVNPTDMVNAEREVIGTGLDLRRIGRVKNDIGGYDHIVRPKDATFAKYLTEETPLKNAYKLNPKAFTPTEGMMYRGLGKEGMEDAFESGVFRAKQDIEPIMLGRFDVSKQFSKAYYSPQFNIADEYGKGYIAEVPRTASDWGRRYGRKEWSQIAQKDIPITEGKILQKDWWKGYKEVPRNKMSAPEITRGPINWWDAPKYKKENPNFNPQTYLNNPVGNQFYSRDIPKGMEPRYFEEKKNGGWLNKYK